MVRVFDILFSALGIISTLPLTLPVMLILKLTGEGEIFYLQPRVGRYRRPFRVLKFATRLKESPNMEGGYLTRRKDPRILPFGRLLRASKINELPQLVNVLLGDMSFVGPRPQALVHFNLYSTDKQRIIQTVRPGLTGVGSLIFRNEEAMLPRSERDADAVHDHVITPYKGDVEWWFVENKTTLLYFKTIFLTVIGMLFPRMRMRRFFPNLPEPPEQISELI